MKKILSMLLVIVMAISLFAGCGKNDTPAPQGTEAPVSTEPSPTHDMPENQVLITGVFYRTKNGKAVLLNAETGAFILQNSLDDFADIYDFSIAQIELETMPETFPAEVTVKSCTLIAQAASSDEMDAVNDLFIAIIDMGYEPASIGTIIDGDGIYLYTTPYDVITTIVDAVAEEEENTMFSPLSLNFALGMAANGVNEEFKQSFENYFGMTIEDYNKYVQYYTNNAAPWFGDTVVDIANSIWVRNPLTLQDDFAQLMSIYYNAEVNARDFDMNFVDEVNKWCAEKTHDMIPSVLGEPPLSDTLLINALYFDGKWDVAYDEEDVRETNFTTIDGETVTVDGMYGSEETFYMENDYATAFAKYYSDYRYAFIGILPKDEGDFQLVDLDIESLMEADNMEMTEVTSMIPKFEFKNGYSLLALLEKIGLPVAQMTFPNITNDTALTISDIIQHTAVEVSETGTRAAAVTVIEMDAMAAPLETEPKTVILDRPFAFMIYDMENQTPLFVGKVTNPVV